MEDYFSKREISLVCSLCKDLLPLGSRRRNEPIKNLRSHFIHFVGRVLSERKASTSKTLRETAVWKNLVSEMDKNTTKLFRVFLLGEGVGFLAKNKRSHNIYEFFERNVFAEKCKHSFIARIV